ncbi:hypothetical protein WMY93_016823 [Mugilogobius chulae]|uniref:C2H2-type domain-containing protein n=1 Tax=Mugilogobius chulae TaxID=88201 RepID=A0AAW0NLV5_9GOBI
MDSTAMDVNVAPTGEANLEAKRFAMEVVASCNHCRRYDYRQRACKNLTPIPESSHHDGRKLVLPKLHQTELRPKYRTSVSVGLRAVVCQLSQPEPVGLKHRHGSGSAPVQAEGRSRHLQRSPDVSAWSGEARVLSAAVETHRGAAAEETGASRHRGQRLREEAKDVRPKAGKDEWKEAPGQSAPTRIKIFEGGYKSNEDYVYVRGRGRGKYICEECGIRCKKPSMLKKHIRTHTDVRPYVCKVCNFAFKTKGNLTKHMKSKAHMKKCLELGVSVSVDDAEIQEQVDDVPKSEASAAKHQFSDAEDSEGAEEEELDEEEEEEEDYDGDSTPKLRSRSTSPQPSAPSSSSPITSLPGAVPKRCSYPPPRPTMTPSRCCLRTRASCLIRTPPASSLRAGSLRSGNPLRPGCATRRRAERCPPRSLHSSMGRFFSFSAQARVAQLQPVQHLSPGVVERPLSPGSEVGKRGRQRVVLRAVSPRRGSHPHKGEKTRQQAKVEMSQQHQQQQQQHGAHDMDMDQKPSVVLSPSARPNLLSHLPLHSQHTQPSLLPARPVGGVQVPPSSPPAPATPGRCPETCPRPLRRAARPGRSRTGPRGTSWRGTVGRRRTCRPV